MVILHSDFLTLPLDKRPMKVSMGYIFFYFFFRVMARFGGIWIGSGYIYCWIERPVTSPLYYCHSCPSPPHLSPSCTFTCAPTFE